jgi:hypothetical protein
MSKDAKAQAITLTLIAAALGVIAWNRGGLDALRRSTRAEGGFLGIAVSRNAEPRDVIYAMLDAARDGIVDDYLDCYAGQMERTLRQSLEEMGEERFSEFLRERNRDIKGIAMNAPKEAGEEAEVRVEYVYADRNEVQEIYLQRTGGDWKIARVSGIRRVETPVPYGTPVY